MIVDWFKLALLLLLSLYGDGTNRELDESLI